MNALRKFIDALRRQLHGDRFVEMRIGAEFAKAIIAEFDTQSAAGAAGGREDVVQRLRDAIEGECDGLGITPESALAILEYIGFDPRGRIVGGRDIDGVWVIEATAISDLMPNHRLVSYEDYLRDKATASPPEAQSVEQRVAIARMLADAWRHVLTDGRDGHDMCANRNTVASFVNAIDAITAALSAQAPSACNCAGGRGAEHCPEHAPTDVLPAIDARVPSEAVEECPNPDCRGGHYYGEHGETIQCEDCASPQPRGVGTDKLEALVRRWEKQAAEHGVRQFTGNDHLLFANELRALIASASGVKS